MLDLIRRALRLDSKPAALVCPHCEKELQSRHDVEACARKRMSRRFFFGIVGGAAAATVVAPMLPKPTGGLFNPTRNVALDYSVSIFPGNSFISPKLLAKEVLDSLQQNLVMAKITARDFDEHFTCKIGDTIQVRRPV